MPRSLLPKVETLRAARLLEVNRNGNGDLQIASAPSTKSEGMYWLLTDYSIDDLKGCIKSPQTGAAGIGLLASLHDGLPHVCTETVAGFRIVYNGITGGGCGLRKRLHQHFNGGEGTGALAISMSSLSDLARWRVSYVSYAAQMDIADVQCVYGDVAVHLERLWRLQHGWPLLCAR